MKKIATLLLSVLLLVGYAKEEFINSASTDSVSTIFYFEGTLEDTMLSKNLAWYDRQSFYVNYNTEIVDELRFNYSWDSRYFSSHNTQHYSADYYSQLTGGSITVEIYDSTLLPSILAKTVHSDEFGDTLQVSLALGLNNTRYRNNGSAFDFRINSVKDTTIGRSLPYSSNFYKIFHISIPHLTLYGIDDPTIKKEVKNLEMRFPVIIYD